MPTFWIRSMKNSKISQYGRSWAALRAHYTFSQELIRGVHMRWRLNFRLSFSSPCLIHWHNTNWIYLSKQAVFRPANYPAEHANYMSKIANGVRLRCECENFLSLTCVVIPSRFHFACVCFLPPRLQSKKPFKTEMKAVQVLLWGLIGTNLVHFTDAVSCSLPSFNDIVARINKDQTVQLEGSVASVLFPMGFKPTKSGAIHRFSDARHLLPPALALRLFGSWVLLPRASGLQRFCSAD